MPAGRASTHDGTPAATTAGVYSSQVRALLLAGGAPAWLSAEEQSDMAAVELFAVDDWLAGRVALKSAYRAMSGEAPSVTPIQRGLTGCPHIASRPALHCSISHSHGWGLGAVSTAPVGVDIERIRSRDAALLPYIAYDEEIALFDREASGTVVTAIWTIKESAMKAWKKGLLIHPRSVVIRREVPGVFSVSCTTAALRLPPLTVRTERKDDFAIAVASTEENHECVRWTDISGVSTSR